MWELFTDRARLAVYFATEEAPRLGEKYVGTEHLMLGLLRDEDNVAHWVLDQLGISPKDLRADIEGQVMQKLGLTGQEPQLTPRAKKVLDLAHEEAQRLGHAVIGTGHILLGLMRDDYGLGAHALRQRGAELEQVRKEVAALQDDEIQPNSPD